MIFKELGILNFGKFENKIIELDSGLNIIFGENEGGKSTIVNFIDGIFYGFSRDSLARKIRDDIFEKSRPWSSSLYKGYIILNYDGKNYRLSRDFDRDEISILNTENGEDLSKDERNFLKSRIAQPGFLFFEISRKLYKSSFFISQRLSQIEEDAAEDLKNKIDNFSVSQDENIDLTKVLEKMNKDLDDLGNKRRKNSEIGRIYTELDKLASERLNFVNLRENYEKVAEKYKETEEKLKNFKDKLRGRKLFELGELKRKLKEIQDEKAKQDENFDFADFERAIEINRTSGLYSSKLDDLLSKEENIFEIDEEVEKDYKKFKEIREEIRLLNENNYSKEIEIISADIKNIEKVVFKYSLKIFFSLLAGGAFIFLAFYFKKYFLIIFSILFFTYSYFRIVKFIENKDLLNRLKNKLVDFKKKSLDKTIKKKEFDQDFEELFEKYNVNDVKALSEILDERKEENLKNVSKNEYNENWKEKNHLEIETTKEKISSLEDELLKILEKYRVKNIKELKNLFYELKDSNKDKTSEYKYRIDELEKENLSGEIYREESLENISKKIKELTIEVSNLDGILRTQEESLEKLRILEEKSFELKDKLKKLEYKRDLLDLSIEKFEAFIKLRRRDTLPILKNNISNYLDKMTKSKYSEILIDDRFDIKVYDKNIDDYVDLDSLSLGTIDQIYLAFRLSISKIITDKKIPLVLDSHFDSYDDERLKNTLEVLLEEEQVLIFSSSNREKEILDKNNSTYKLIRL
ncbi:ATP-binding protein [Peptoniphilus gorbachii]|uniref:Chromosome segregation ATPase n=1 Tax=Peptoniphilus gorbachii TaxID=411567 RepID=A0ABS2MHL6_9FIRM|nr:AAA family ATPase [Peptoniphilus gorbachii]MBM7549503.1 chromosome segregation ATPase [Peptoniphilus gorbachii]